MNQIQNELILVDGEDRALNALEKEACHDGEGRRHRAFSIFIFDDKGRILVQKRSAKKRLWPGFWSNSCCSHPRWGEAIGSAATRRVGEELGTQVSDLVYVFKFEYQASFQDVGSEWELCHVFFARANDIGRVDPSEIEAWQWMTREQLQAALVERPGDFTPWLHLEWVRLETRFSKLLTTYCQLVPSSCT